MEIQEDGWMGRHCISMDWVGMYEYREGLRSGSRVQWSRWRCFGGQQISGWSLEWIRSDDVYCILEKLQFRSVYTWHVQRVYTRYASYLQLIDHFSSAPYYRIDIHSSQISNYYNYYCYWMLHLQPGLASSKAFIFHSAQLVQSVRLHHIHQPLIVSEISRVFSSIYIPF